MKYLSIFVCILALGLQGCASTDSALDSDTKKGAAVGALAGAAIGGIVGHQDGHGWEGALIGTAAGATTGGVVGHQLEKREESATAYIPVTEVAEMAVNGVPDSVMISEIERSGSTYHMSMDTIDYLRENNVSNEVIDYMMEVSP